MSVFFKTPTKSSQEKVVKARYCAGEGLRTRRLFVFFWARLIVFFVATCGLCRSGREGLFRCWIRGGIHLHYRLGRFCSVVCSQGRKQKQIPHHQSSRHDDRGHNFDGFACFDRHSLSMSCSSWNVRSLSCFQIPWPMVGFESCAELANSGTSSTLTELRCSLSFEARRDRHSGGLSTDEELIRDLLRAIRQKVEAGELA